MGEWKEFSIEDFAEILNQKRVPLSSMERAGRKGIYPYYGASGVIDSVDDFLFEGEHLLISEDGENLKTRQTPIAFTANGKFWVNNHAHVLKGKKDFHNRLLVYYFGNLDLNPFLTGAAQPKLNKAALLSIPIFLPEKESEQRAIAQILASLDEKIALLHRQNRTLEGLAGCVWRGWFGVGGEGWAEKGLDKIAEFLNGLPCQKYPVIAGEESLPVIKIKELRTGITVASDWATANVPEKYIVRDGDILFSWSGSLELVLWSGGKGVLNQHLFKVIPEGYPDWFCYFWIKEHLTDFRQIAHDKATTMGHIQRHHLTDAVVLIPPSEKLEIMDKTIAPIFQKIKTNQTQLRTLTNLRDTLLPKLMSGELRVRG